MSSMSRVRCVLFLLIGSTLALTLAGCGPSASVGQISGKVTCDGQPVGEGLVSFHNPDTGAAAQAELESDGTFQVSNTEGGLPPGDYRVTIMPPTVQLPDTAETEGGLGFKDVVNIPQKYRSAKTSSLTAAVELGRNDLDFAMQTSNE